jgi:hypothetical protein
MTKRMLFSLFEGLVATFLIAILTGLLILLKFPLVFIIAIPIALILLVLILYFFGKWRARPTPFMLGRIIANHHLNQVKSIPEFEDARLSKSNPLYSLSNDKIVAYDVKLVDELGEDKGYILVNLDRNESPVVFFTSEGPSISEYLHRQVPDEEDIRIIYLTPMYQVALDADNNIVASHGDFFFENDVGDEFRSKQYTKLDLLRWISKKTQDNLKSFKTSVREEWDVVDRRVGEVYYGGDSFFSLVKDDPPYKQEFEIHYAEGYRRSPRLVQIDPNTGLNDTDHHSGCAATAWACFIRYHDLLWTPELLKGSQDTNTRDWGNPSHPNFDEADTCYNNRVIMALREKLQTFGTPINGGTFPWDVDQGFDFIADELFHYTSSRTHWKSHSTSVQKTYKYITKKERPVIAGIASHLCVIEGFCQNVNSLKLDRQWLYVNSGDGGKGFVKAKHLDQVWYTTHVYPRRQETYTQFSGQSGVDSVTTRLDIPDRPRANLWAFWLSNARKINYARTVSRENQMMANQYLNVNSKVDLDMQALYTPSVCSDGNAIYMVYADTNKKIHLMRYSVIKEDLRVPEKDCWVELPFPDVETEVRPAIAGAPGDWMTIAFCNQENGVQKMATNLDIEKPGAWPERPYISGTLDLTAQSTWFLLGGIGSQQTNQGLGLVRYQNETLVCWIRTDGKLSIWWCKGGLWGSNAPIRQWDDSNGKWVPNTMLVDSAPSLFLSNNTVFMTCAKETWLAPEMDHRRRIFVYAWTISTPAEPLDTSVNPPILVERYVDVVEISRLTEACVGDPCMGNWGISPMLVWLNDNHDVTLRRISIDTWGDPINYAGFI